MVLTVDAICCGVHYLPQDPPDLVARKLMRVNLSDLAAMGASPAGVLLTCAYSADCDEAWIDRFVSGLAQDVAAFDVPVLGGDTVSTRGPALFSLTALGWVPQGAALRRNGARAGDLIAVTGTLGDGALGLEAAQSLYERPDAASERPYLRPLAERYHLPRPRLGAGIALRGVASAALDVSDGLVQDLGHICRASGVQAELDVSLLPLSEAFVAACQHQGRQGVPLALTGGDDYELCITLPPQSLDQARALVAEVGLTVIGRCKPLVMGQGPEVTVRDGQGALLSLDTAGWQHF
jgi:thiamine-monophosphate kinase